jgi:hypothetical protein
VKDCIYKNVKTGKYLTLLGPDVSDLEKALKYESHLYYYKGYEPAYLSEELISIKKEIRKKKIHKINKYNEREII